MMHRSHWPIGVIALTILVQCTGSGASRPKAPTAHISSDLAANFNGGGCYPMGLHSILPSPLDQIGQIVLVNPEWAPLLNGKVVDSEPVLVHATVLQVHGDTAGDYPATHAASDYVATIQPDEADASRLATANLSSEGGAMELEWESDAIPDWAWAGEGDRIVTLGRWIFDCGHPDATPGNCSRSTEKECLIDSDCRPPACPTCGADETCTGAHFEYTSEIHPPQATAVIRAGRGGRVSPEPGAPASPATRADVFVSAFGGGAGDRCVLTHHEPTTDVIFHTDCYPLKEPVAPVNSRDFIFDLPLPPKPPGGEVSWQVIQRDLLDRNGVAADFDVKPELGGASPHLEVRVKMTEATSQGLPTGFAATFFAGWKNDATKLTHVRVTVEDAVIQNDLRVPTPVVRDVRSWSLQAAANGEWKALSGLAQVSSGDVIPQALVWEQYLFPAGELRIVANGAVRVCLDTIFGNSLSADTRKMGLVPMIECLLTNGQNPDPGTIDVAYPGPDFGAGSGVQSYETASQGAAGGTCSVARDRLCRSDGDCLAGESCVKSAYSLRYRIERVD